MRQRFLLVVALLACTSHALGAAKTLRWNRLAVTAHLDADGRLHVEERHAIVFSGDWNGGERTFRERVETVRRLDRLSRVDESGQEIPLRKDDSLTGVDTFAWKGSTLRWRSRLPTDPEFEDREITYVIAYTESNILVPDGGEYRLDHNFGLPNLEWPVGAYSLDLTLDPAWQPIDRVPARLTRANLLRGENVTVTARLRHTGAALPAGVSFGAPAVLRFALLVALAAGLGIFAWEFRLREQSLGRFWPLPAAETIDRQWLEEHLFKFSPEVVGAAWDDRTGAAEVSAVIARLVQEGKLASRLEKGTRGKDDLVLTLLRPKETFDGYEATLVRALFIAGDTTSGEQIKEHYKGVGFDPVSQIRAPLEKRAGAIGDRDTAPPIERIRTMILIGMGGLLVVLGGLAGALNILAALVEVVLIIAFYLAGFAGAVDYRRRLSKLGLFSLEFVPAALLVLAGPIVLLADTGNLRFGSLMLSGLALIALGAVNSLFNLAKTRDAGDRLATRRRLTAAREYFARELARPKPALDDAWFPYVVAFGLADDADRWFRSFGGTSAASPDRSLDTGSLSSSGSSSSGWSSSGSPSSQTASGWTGFAGGRSGGAGASGAWAVAAAGLASGVPSPSSSSSGGGSSGGGSSSSGSSGGGGAGGW